MISSLGEILRLLEKSGHDPSSVDLAQIPSAHGGLFAGGPSSSEGVYSKLNANRVQLVGTLSTPKGPKIARRLSSESTDARLRVLGGWSNH